MSNIKQSLKKSQRHRDVIIYFPYQSLVTPNLAFFLIKYTNYLAVMAPSSSYGFTITKQRDMTQLDTESAVKVALSWMFSMRFGARPPARARLGRQEVKSDMKAGDACAVAPLDLVSCVSRHEKTVRMQMFLECFLQFVETSP